MSVASSSTPFAQHAQRVTAKLRSRMHAQSFSAVVMDAQRRRLTPTGKVAVQRVDELKNLVETHRRTFDPKSTSRARDIFQSLPLLSSDEDPHFSTSICALRYAAYFQLAEAPATFALLNHLVQHAHFLDGYNVFSLCEVLVELASPQTGEALEILRPRVLELLTGSRQWDKIDFTACEAAFVLRTMAQYKVLDEAVLHAATAIMVRTGAGLPIQDVCEILQTWRRLLRHYQLHSLTLEDKGLAVAAQNDAQAFLTATQATVLQYLEEGRTLFAAAHATGAQHADGAGLPTRSAAEEADLIEALHLHRRLVREVTRTTEAAAWGPRHLLVDISRSVVAWSDVATLATPTTVYDTVATAPRMPSLSRRDLAALARMLRSTSFRDERALCVVAARLAVADVTPCEAGDRSSNDASRRRASETNEGVMSAFPHDGTHRPLARASTREVSRVMRERLSALTDYVDAVDALGFFSQVRAVSTVSALLSYSAHLLTELDAITSSSATAVDICAYAESVAVTQVTRLLSSLVSLQYTTRVLATAPDEWMTSVHALLTCAAVQQAGKPGRPLDHSLLPLARLTEALAAFTAMLSASALPTAAGAVAPPMTSSLEQTCAARVADLLAALHAAVSTSGSRDETSAARAEALAHFTAAVSTLRAGLPEKPHEATDGTPGDDVARLHALLASLN